MRRLAIAAVTGTALIAAPIGASAQTAAPAPAAAEATAPAPKPRKPRGPVPASAVTITNASANTATQVVVAAEGKTATLSRPLAPKARASLKLPKLKSCLVSVTATFEGAGAVEIGEVDVCKEKTIRFTEG